nr:gliding motility-associated C-terminal domain-containing protein [Flavipsychrobacter sp.]
LSAAYWVKSQNANAKTIVLDAKTNLEGRKDTLAQGAVVFTGITADQAKQVAAKFGFDLIPAQTAAPIVSGAGFFCAGSNILMKCVPPPGYANSNYSFVWTFPDGSKHTDSIYNFPNAQAGPSGPSGTYQVYMTVDTGNGGPLDTSATATVQIYVQQIPPPPAVASLITFCQNSQADSIPIYGQNLRWYSVAIGGTATTTAPTVNTSQTGSFTYYVAQSLNGCESNRVPVTVQVVPPAPPPTVTTPVSYCQNETAVPLSAVGQNLLWYSTDTGGVGTPIVPTPTTVAQGKTYWYVTQTIDGCESIRVPIEIMVNYRPNALMMASRPYVCAGDTLTFTYYGNADGDTGVTFNWTFPTGTTVLSGTGQGPYVVRFDSSGQPMLKLIADNHGCMSPEAKYLVEVRALPKFDIDMQDQACVGDVVNVTSLQITPAIDSFLWDFDGGSKTYASETAGPFGIIWASSGQKTVTVVATDNACKSAPVQDVITIRELPDASIRRVNGGNKICAGDSVLLESSYRWDYTYFWQPTQYFSEQNQYRQWARIDYGRMVSLQITDGFNCTATDSIWLQPENCCEVYFPSAFSPNGDGRNDIFRPITQGHQKISLFVVKNRWGQQVYEGLDDRWGWDGTFAGKAQDVGVYFYYIKYKCADGKYYEDKGEVTLVR